MEYVGCDDCDKMTWTQPFVHERLLRIPNPTAAPGPIAGGIVIHRFFPYHLSSVQYGLSTQGPGVRTTEQKLSHILLSYPKAVSLGSGSGSPPRTVEIRTPADRCKSLDRAQFVYLSRYIAGGRRIAGKLRITHQIFAITRIPLGMKCPL